MNATRNSPLDAIFLPELLDLIFEHVSYFHDETNSLGDRPIFACSLVCRCWHAQAFRHNFRSLSLFVCPETSTSAALSAHEVEGAQFTIQELISLELFGRVQSVVRRLILHYGIPGRYDDITLNFPRFVRLFPGLQALELHGMLANRDARTVPAPLIPFIRSLSVNGSYCGHSSSSSIPNNPYALCDILSQFGSIFKLTLYGLRAWLSEPPSSAVLQTMQMPQVHSLVLRFTAIPQFAPVINRLLEAGPVQQLDLLYYTGPKTARLFRWADYLSNMPPHVLIGAGGVLDSTEISGCKGIKRVTIVVGVAFELVPSFGAQPWQRLRKILASLDSGGSLDYIELILASVDVRMSFENINAALKTHIGIVRECENVLLGMAQKRRLGHVRVALSSASPDELLAAHSSALILAGSACVFQTAFSRLYDLGVLYA